MAAGIRGADGRWAMYETAAVAANPDLVSVGACVLWGPLLFQAGAIRQSNACSLVLQGTTQLLAPGFRLPQHVRWHDESMVSIR